LETRSSASVDHTAIKPFSLLSLAFIFWVVPLELEEAASSMVAVDTQIFWHVVLPWSHRDFDGITLVACLLGTNFCCSDLFPKSGRQTRSSSFYSFQGRYGRNGAIMARPFVDRPYYCVFLIFPTLFVDG